MATRKLHRQRCRFYTTSVDANKEGSHASLSLLAGSNPREVTTRIADAALEMRNMAKFSNLTFLTYLLEMVFQEAFELSRRSGPSEGDEMAS